MASHLIKSMTGFGSAEASVGNSRIAVEIKSVNHRFFSPSIKTPSSLARLEADIRELLQRRVIRGHVTVSVRVGTDVESGPKIDFARVAAYAEQVAALQQQFGLTQPVSLDVLLRLPQVVTSEDQTTAPDRPEDILSVVRQALDEMDQMRAIEGRKLTAIIVDRLD